MTYRPFYLPLHSITPAETCTCGHPECWERDPATGKPIGKPGKHPRTNHGVDDASADPAVHDGWVSQYPDGMNWALRTGPESGAWVLDVDGAEGFQSLAALEAVHGALPPTLTVKTGSGGRHYYFRYPTDRHIGNTVKSLAPGLDTRGNRGYVVVPPSNHWSGSSYEWGANPGIADAPAWLLELVKPPAVAPPPPLQDDGPCEGWAGFDDDAELVADALSMRGSCAQAFGGAAPYARLLPLDPAVVDEFHGGDRSAAEMSLFCRLAWLTGCDAPRMERIASDQGWRRQKWESNAGYIPRTIAKAIELTRGKPPYRRRGAPLDLPGKSGEPSDKNLGSGG